MPHQILLALWRQSLKQYTRFPNESECIVQCRNMRLAVSVPGLKSRFDGAALILPFAPEYIPSCIGQLPFGMLAGTTQFFVG
jgi:hypothetical protein